MIGRHNRYSLSRNPGEGTGGPAASRKNGVPARHSGRSVHSSGNSGNGWYVRENRSSSRGSIRIRSPGFGGQPAVHASSTPRPALVSASKIVRYRSRDIGSGYQNALASDTARKRAR